MPSSLSALGNTVLDRLFPARKLLAERRAAWGRAGAKDSWGVSAHFDLISDSAVERYVDDKTWRDLEFPKLLAQMDNTVTPLGSQMLYYSLRTYVDDDAELASRFDVFHMLRTHAALRERVQLALAPLADDAYADGAETLFGAPLHRFAYPRWLLLWSGLSVALMLAAIFTVVPWWTAAVAVAVNAAIIFSSLGHLRREAERLKHALGLLYVAEHCSAIRAEAALFPALDRLREQLPDRKRVRARLRLMACLQIEAVQWVSVWLNLAFLLELAAYLHARKAFVETLPVFQQTYALLGSIDAAVAVASFLERLPAHCRATV